MKKILTVLAALFCVSTVVGAEPKTVYITDYVKYTLRSQENKRSKILKMLPSGSELTLISENKASGYSKIRTSEGVVGFILSRFILDTPVSSWHLKEANKKLEILQLEYDVIKDELTRLIGNNDTTLVSNLSLSEETSQLNKELSDLRQTAANAIRLKQQRDQLQERVITVERELQQIKRENQTLEDSTNQDWFLYGGVLSLIGVILGFLLPKLSWRRKTNNWDSF